MNLSFLVAFSGGLFSFLSPCVLPLVPTYLLYLGGERGRPLRNALFFILGFGLIFTLLGLPFTLLGHLLATNKTLLTRIGGAVVVIFGLYLLGLRLPWLSREVRWTYQGETSQPWGAFLLGMAFSVGWTPCIGPVLGSILTLTAVSGSGIGLLLAYTLGLAVPFLVLAFFADRAVAWVRRANRYTVILERAAGVLMLVVGLLLLSDRFTLLNNFFQSLTPTWLQQHI